MKMKCKACRHLSSFTVFTPTHLRKYVTGYRPWHNHTSQAMKNHIQTHRRTRVLDICSPFLLFLFLLPCIPLVSDVTLFVLISSDFEKWGQVKRNASLGLAKQLSYVTTTHGLVKQIKSGNSIWTWI